MTEVLTSRVGGHGPMGEDRFEVRSPADGEVLAEVSRAGADDVDRAVASARQAWEDSRSTPTTDRLALLHAIADLIDDRVADLGAELSREQGKPVTEAEGEVAFAAAGLRACAEDFRRMHSHGIVSEDPAKRVHVIRQRRGVWAVVTPWNFPFNIPVEYLGPALATGSPFVWKPAPTTSRIASRLYELMVEAGVSDQAANLLLTDSVETTTHLLTHPGIDCVGLTGGARTGRAVAQACWDKHLVLELGGNGPIVVLDDADLPSAAAAIAHAAFWNAGQVCSAAGRVIVADSVAEELSALLVDHAHAITVGDPLDRTVSMGPVHTPAVVASVRDHVLDAVERGGRVLAGTVPERDPSGQFVTPIVMEVDTPDSRILAEETFGPVAPLHRVHGHDELAAAATSGSFGLVAAVFTQRLDRAYHLAERLGSGTVVVNDTSNYWESRLPFGGWAGTESGRGRVGGVAALEEFTQTKTVSMHVGRADEVSFG